MAPAFPREECGPQVHCVALPQRVFDLSKTDLCVEERCCAGASNKLHKEGPILKNQETAKAATETRGGGERDTLCRSVTPSGRVTGHENCSRLGGGHEVRGGSVQSMHEGEPRLLLPPRLP